MRVRELKEALNVFDDDLNVFIGGSSNCPCCDEFLNLNYTISHIKRTGPNEAEIII